MKLASGTVWGSLALLLVFVAGGVALQVFLSRRESRWPGLVLPALTFLLSLLQLLSLVAYDSAVQTLVTALTVLLIGNLPTLVLLAVYWACREKRRKRAELDKMNIQDL